MLEAEPTVTALYGILTGSGRPRAAPPWPLAAFSKLESIAFLFEAAWPALVSALLDDATGIGWRKARGFIDSAQYLLSGGGPMTLELVRS